jgi:hypothetical protein
MASLAISKTACRCRKLCHLMRPGHIRGSGRRAVPPHNPDTCACCGRILAFSGRVLVQLSTEAESRPPSALGHCAFGSGAILLGVGLNTWAGWWWADPADGLIIAALAVKEGSKPGNMRSAADGPPQPGNRLRCRARRPDAGPRAGSSRPARRRSCHDASPRPDRVTRSAEDSAHRQACPGQGAAARLGANRSMR